MSKGQARVRILDVLCFVDRIFFSRTAGGRSRDYSLYYNVVFPVLSRVSTWLAHLLLRSGLSSIDGIAENLVVSSKSEEDQIETLFHYVMKTVKRLPIRGWLSAEEVHSLHHGDCKHMSILLSALLKQIGKDSTVVEGFTNWKANFTKNMVDRPRLHVWVRVEGKTSYICDPTLNYFGSEKGFEELVNGFRELYHLETVEVTAGRNREIKGRRLYVEQT